MISYNKCYLKAELQADIKVILVIGFTIFNTYFDIDLTVVALDIFFKMCACKVTLEGHTSGIYYF